MARFAPEKFEDRKQVAVNRMDGEKTQVVARPVDTYVRPVESDLLRLTETLAQVTPSLNQALKAHQKVDDEDQRAAGMKYRTENTDTDVPPPESSRAFREGFMAIHGTLAGQSLKEKIINEVEANKHNAGFNAGEYARQAISAGMQGMQNKESIDGFLKSVTGLAEHMDGQQQKLQLEMLRQENRNQLFGLAREETKRVGLDGASHRAWLESFVEQARKQNLPSTDAYNLAAEALIHQANETKDVKWLEAANVKGKDGIALADNPELAKKFMAARDHVEKLQRQQLALDANEANKLKAEEYQAMAHDPNTTFEQEVSWIKRHSQGVNAYFGTDNAVSSALAAAYKRHEGKKVNEYFDGLERKGMLASGKGLPGFSQYITARRAPMWEKALAGDQDGFNELLNHIASTGEVDERMKGLMSSTTMNLPLKNGKFDGDKLPTSFTVARQLYVGLREKHYPMIEELMGADGARQMEMYNRALSSGMTDIQALESVKQLETPEAKQRRKRLDGQEGKDMRETISSSLKGFFDTGSVFSADNLDEAVTKVAAMASDIYARGATDHNAAAEFAVTKFKANNRIVNGLWMEMPKGFDQDAVQRQMAVEINDFTKNFNVSKDHLLVTLLPGGKEYLLKDWTNPSETIAKRVPVSDLADKGRQKAFLTDSQLSESGNLRLAIDQGKLTPEQANANITKIQDYFVAGHINAKQFEKAQSMSKAFQKKHEDDTLKQTLEMRRKFSQMVDVGDLQKDNLITDLSRQIPQPGGRNMDTYHYVKQYLNTDPTSALTMMNEGLRLKRYQDPNGKDWDIGFGYNMSSRDSKQVKSDLARAGVAPGDIDDVIQGRKEIQPQHAVALFQLTRKEYEANAEKTLGKDTWQALPPNLKAVFTDLAYASGDAGKFKQAVEQVKQGNFEWLGNNLMIHYQRDGKMVADWRRIGLLRAMAKGTDVFGSYVSTAQKSYKQTDRG